MDGTRLFGRIHALDFECPRCGTIHQIRPHKKTRGWYPRWGSFVCPACSITLQFGLLIYPTAAGNAALNRIPEDWIPNPRQAAALRSLQTAIHLPESARRRPGTAPKNRRSLPCTCMVVPDAKTTQEGQPVQWRTVRHPACPVHSG